MKILVMSCDKNEDLFYPFHHCMEKYWPEHPEIIYSTETVTNPYYKTICKNYPLEKWTKRIRETVEEIDDEFILILCDDLFIREPVTQDVESLCSYITGKIANINFEKTFDKEDKRFNDLLLVRSKDGKYKNSCLCSLWNKKYLIKVFSKDATPWQMEQLNQTYDFTYLILKDYILKWEDPNTHWRWGLVRKGKWKKEAKDFFDSEGVIIDYNKRDFIK